MSARRAGTREAGFTLVELLVAMTILGIVMVPLSTAFVLALRTSDTANGNIADGNDAALLAAYFPPDVHAAGGEPGDVAIGSDAGSACSGMTNVVTLTGRGQEDSGSATTTWTSAYAIEAVGSSSWRLLRAHCIDGGAPEIVPVMRHIAAADAATVVSDGTHVSITVLGAGAGAGGSDGATIEVSANRRST